MGTSDGPLGIVATSGKAALWGSTLGTLVALTAEASPAGRRPCADTGPGRAIVKAKDKAKDKATDNARDHATDKAKGKFSARA
jgi:hypothetical protein